MPGSRGSIERGTVPALFPHNRVRAAQVPTQARLFRGILYTTGPGRPTYSPRCTGKDYERNPPAGFEALEVSFEILDPAWPMIA